MATQNTHTINVSVPSRISDLSSKFPQICWSIIPKVENISTSQMSPPRLAWNYNIICAKCVCRCIFALCCENMPLAMLFTLCVIKIYYVKKSYWWNFPMLVCIHCWLGPKVWFPRFIRFQVRYGHHWAPVHPENTIPGILTEMILVPEEVLTHLNAATGLVIDAMAFTSNLHTFPTAGRRNRSLTKSVPLEGLSYFSGALKHYHGLRVSRLVAHLEKCEIP